MGHLFESNMAVESEETSIDESTTEFLRKKGAMEILAEIGEEGPQRHTDLREELLLSSSTIQKRLKAGREYDLWELTLQPRDGTDAKVYKLTQLGDQLYTHVNQDALSDLYKARRGLISEIELRERKVLIEMAPDDADWLLDMPAEKYGDGLDRVQKTIGQF